MSPEILYCYRVDGRRCYTPSLVVASRRHNSVEDITYEISQPKKNSKKKKQ